MKDWKWFLERSKDFQNEPEHPLSNKEELFELFWFYGIDNYVFC